MARGRAAIPQAGDSAAGVAGFDAGRQAALGTGRVGTRACLARARSAAGGRAPWTVTTPCPYGRWPNWTRTRSPPRCGAVGQRQSPNANCARCEVPGPRRCCGRFGAPRSRAVPEPRGCSLAGAVEPARARRPSRRPGAPGHAWADRAAARLVHRQGLPGVPGLASVFGIGPGNAQLPIGLFPSASPSRSPAAGHRRTASAGGLCSWPASACPRRGWAPRRIRSPSRAAPRPRGGPPEGRPGLGGGLGPVRARLG